MDYLDNGERMKKIGILLPCYNENGNVEPIARDIIDIFSRELPEYDYKIVFIDNASNDGTDIILKKMCAENDKIAAIFNARNFNYYSSWYGIRNTPGDCVIQIPSDRQVPVTVIPQLVREWEKGHDFVGAIKSESRESRIMWMKRQIFYKFSNFFADIEEPLNNLVATLYDRSLLEICKKTEDPLMFKSLRVFMTKYSKSMSKVFVVQEARKSGKSKNNRKGLVKIGMMRITENSTSIPYDIFALGLTTVVGTIISLVAYILCIAILGAKMFELSVVILLILGFIMGGFICFSGLMAEYIMKINDRCAAWPGVVERERINLDI